MKQMALMGLVMLLWLTGCAAATNTPSPSTNSSKPVITVYKSPTCGCCGGWVSYMAANGYSVMTEDINDVTVIKEQYGIPPELYSCHTATVDGYVLEGHVPVEAIERLLQERPDVVGIAVPGMPLGSPGMESAGRAAEPYDVVTFDQSGQTRVYERYPK